MRSAGARHYRHSLREPSIRQEPCLPTLGEERQLRMPFVCSCRSSFKLGREPVTNQVHPTESLGKRLMPDLATGSGSVCANGTIVNCVTGSYNPNVLGLSVGVGESASV